MTWFLEHAAAIATIGRLLESIVGLIWALFGRARSITIGQTRLGPGIQTALRLTAPIPFSIMLIWAWGWAPDREAA